MPESLTSEILEIQRPYRIQLNETTKDFCVLPKETSRYKDKRAPGKVFKLMTCCSTLFIVNVLPSNLYCWTNCFMVDS